MNSLIRFTIIAAVLAGAALLILAIGGVLSSSELWSNAVKIGELIGVMFVASALIMFISKK